MTFRIGQKVRCVQEIEVQTPWGTIYTGPTPVLDATYTVTGFGDTGMMAVDGILDAECGITLAELRGPRARAARTDVWRELCWPIEIFRPLVERETDISFAHEILHHASQTEDA